MYIALFNNLEVVLGNYYEVKDNGIQGELTFLPFSVIGENPYSIVERTLAQNKVVPSSVFAFQAVVALDAFQLLDDVEELMKKPEVPRQVKLAWDKASHFYRQSPLVVWAASQLNLTEDQIDDLFIYASTINYDESGVI